MPTNSTAESEPNARKLARVYGMAGALIDELHQGQLDDPSRSRLERLTRDSLVEMGSAIPDDLLEELHRLVPPGDGTAASQAELRVLWAQMLGWIAGVALSEQFDEAQDVAGEQREAVARAASNNPTARIAQPYM